MSEKSINMTALVFDGKLQVKTVPKPKRGPNEVLIQVTMAGICNTDLEIIRGYISGFNNIPGHEFLGLVKEADDTSIIGKRCTAEINCSCGRCDYCRNGLGRHCPERTVLGIINRSGAFAEYICVPKENLFLVPDTLADKRAIFIEPLAAALEILDQVKINQDSKVLLLGDGKLGLLIGYVLASKGCNLTIVGKHPEKLANVTGKNVKNFLLSNHTNSKYDIVVEATGNVSAFEKALQNVKPRGTLILKSTYADDINFNPSQVIIDEITIIGSRCGDFQKAINFMLKNDPKFRS